MPTYKLTYFNATGTGETIRFLLSYGGVDFEDNRIELEDWPNHKPKMPMGQVPIFEIDGKVYRQSRAINRHFAKKFNVYGSDDLQAIEVDASVDDVEDWRMWVSRYYHDKDPTYRAKLKSLALEKTSFILGKLEERAKSNGGYFVGGKMSWADIQFAATVDVLSYFLDKEVIKDYPTLHKLYDNVLAVPNIKAYLEKRPKTKF